MNDMFKHKEQSSLQAVAIEWFVHLRSPELGGDEVVRFDQWLNADPAHKRAFEQIDVFWIASKDLQDSVRATRMQKVVDKEKAQKSDDKKQRKRPDTAVVIPLRQYKLLHRLKPVYAITAAASILLAVMVIRLLTPPESAVHFTQTGEQKTLKLQDGSTLTLNTATTLEVEFTNSERRLTLVRGQASFDVAHDKSRPFTVNVGYGSITALGTRFDVYKARGKTVVTLLDGEVEVAKTDTGNDGSLPIRLLPGQRVSLPHSGAMSAIANINPEQATAWRHGKLNFDETPLTEVLAEANRYTKLKLKLGSQSLAQLPVTGIFATGASEDIALALETLYGLKINRMSEHLMVIWPKE